MAMLQELMYGPGTATAYPVPDPNASMADLLAGGVPAAAPAPAGNVATAYADSPAPGGVASAAAQAQAAASNEPGIIDRAREWASKNPTQAQALMQGFAALASGRTRGGFVQQMGQAAGVAGQTMIEQNAANAQQQREIEERNRRMTLQEREATSTIGARDSASRRAEALLPGQLEAQDLAAEGAEQRIVAGRQDLEQKGALFTPKMEEAKLKLQSLKQQIAEAGTDADLKKLRIQEAALNLSIQKQFGPAQAQAVLDTAVARAAGAQEQATQEVLQTDAAVRAADADKLLTPQEKADAARGIKPKAPPDPVTIAKDFLTRRAEYYLLPNGKTDYAKLAKDVDAAVKAGTPGAVDTSQQAWEAARNSVKPGQPYIGPDGREYTRK